MCVLDFTPCVQCSVQIGSVEQGADGRLSYRVSHLAGLKPTSVFVTVKPGFMLTSNFCYFAS